MIAASVLVAALEEISLQVGNIVVLCYLIGLNHKVVVHIGILSQIPNMDFQFLILRPLVKYLKYNNLKSR